MPLTEEIEGAARELGRILSENPAVLRYRAAVEQAGQDESLCAMEASLAELYAGLTAREKQGEVLPRAEINRYHNLREQVRRHPLYAAREDALRDVKRSFGTASEALSSALTVDFNTLASE
jgi:hypothetical protein